MSRRDPGTGSVYQRKDGSWVAQFDGKYRYAKTKQEAKKKLRHLLQQADEVKPSNITVGTVLADYLQSAKTNLKPRTVQRYQAIIENHLKPALGRVKLHTLTAIEIENVYAHKLDEGLSASTVQVIHAVLSAAIKRAVRLQLVQTNVCRDVQRPKIQRDEVEVFDPSEVAAILSAAKHHRLEAFWVLAMTTGMRHGEIVGLYVEDYVPGRGTLDIRRTVYNNVVGTLKSKRSRRTIKLPLLAQRALDAHLDAHRPSRAYIFTNGAGNPIRNNTFVTCLWRPFLQRVGVEYKNSHTCRHYVASTVLSKGLPITAVARFLGHDERTLLSTYSHLMPDQMDTVAAAMDEALG
jgi:integrase